MANIEVIDSATDYRTLFGDPSDSYSQSESRTSPVRAVAIVNGIRVALQKVEIHGAVHGASDTADITLALAGGPDWSEVFDTALEDGTVIVEVWAGFPSDPTLPETDTSQLTRRFLGAAQGFEGSLTPDGGDEITIRVQSLAALLTAEKRTTNIQGMTTVDIVNGIAKEMGLQAVVTLADGQQPVTMAQVFEQEQYVGTHNLRISDLLTACCQADDTYWRVSTFDGSLQYLTLDKSHRKSLPLRYGVDPILSLRPSHYLFNRHIEVQCHTFSEPTSLAHSVRLRTNGSSYDMQESSRIVTSAPVWGQDSKVVTATTVDEASGASTTTVTDITKTGGAKSSGYTSFAAISNVEKYKYFFHGLTRDQANAEAISRWKQLSRFEYAMEITLSVTPENLQYLNLDTLFQLSGCPLSKFNSSPKAPYYFPREYHESIAMSEDGGESPGWQVEFTMLNHRLPPGE